MVRRSRWGVSHGHRGPGRVGSGFPDHRPCTGGGKPWRGSCSSRPAVVPSFSNAGQCPPLLPISPWPTAPRGCIGGVPCPQGIGRVWDQDLQLRYLVDGSPTCAPAHFSLPPVSSFSDGASVLCSCSSRPAVVPVFAAAILQQRRLTFCAPAHLAYCPAWPLSERGNSPFRSGGCRWGESGFSWASLERSQKYWWH